MSSLYLRLTQPSQSFLKSIVASPAPRGAFSLTVNADCQTPCGRLGTIVKRQTTVYFTLPHTTTLLIKALASIAGVFGGIIFSIVKLFKSS